MAKLSELVARELSKPANADKTSEQIADDLYSQELQRAKKLREDLKRARPTRDKKLDVNIALQPDGTLALTQSLIKDGLRLSGKDTLLQSDALSKLANAIRPLLGVARAIAKANGMVKNQPLHELDSDQRRTNQILKNEDGQNLFNVDPLTQLKHVCYILENNEQAQKALQIIADTLRNVNSESMKNLAVTQEVINSKKPIEVKERTSQSPRTLPLKPKG